jgi:hypothetical protein
MALCSYCGEDRKPTREHLIPDWYLQIDRSPDDVTFLERVKKRFIDSDPVIRDVCAICNNGPLSELDDYGKALYTEQLSEYIYAGFTTTLQADFEKLAKWLLKVSFNSARINRTDLEILAPYSQLLLGHETLPDHFLIFAATVAPASDGESGEPTCAELGDTNAHLPAWFRIGVFRVPELDTISWSFRHVAINSYCFYLAVPSLTDPAAIKEAAAISEAMTAEPNFGVQLSRSGSTELRPPAVDALTYSLSHIGAFPFSYGIVQNPALKHALETEYGLVTYLIDREDIESGNETNFLSFLSEISSCREIAVGFQGRVEIYIHGYDEDPRELYDIPEVLTFLRKIDQIWPYWMLYQFGHGDWLKVLAVCLGAAVRDTDGQVRIEGRVMNVLIDRWFVALNELSHRFALTHAINKEASERAIRLLLPDMVNVASK